MPSAVVKSTVLGSVVLPPLVTVKVNVPAPSFTVTLATLKDGRSSFVPLVPLPLSRIVPVPFWAIVALAAFDSRRLKLSEPS